MNYTEQNEITEEHILEFNNSLQNEGSVIRLKQTGEIIDICLANTTYIKNFNINPTKEFYKRLESFFIAKGILTLSYNNTGSCFWKTN